MAAAETLHVQRDRPVGSAAPPRRSASSAGARADRSSAARSGSGRSADRRRGARSRSTAKAASSCGTTMPARSRGSCLTQVSSCQSLTARDSAAANSRLRSSMPPRLNCISMPYSTPLASRCCAAHQLEIGARRARRSGNASTRMPATPSCAARRAGPTGPGADARRRSSCARASAPAGTDADPPACDRPDGCRNRRSRALRRAPACRSGTFIARPPALPRIIAASRAPSRKRG